MMIFSAPMEKGKTMAEPRKCKIRITKEIEGLFPECCPKVGKIYNAEYVESTIVYQKGHAISVINMAGKRVIIREDEFELVG
jgi:hypothetical protein